MSFAIRTLLAGAAFLITGAVNAGPSGTQIFVQPTGTVGPTDSIEVWVRYTVDAGSVPLHLDSSIAGFGVDPADVPASWSSLTEAGLNTSFLCSGTFTAGCLDGPPYRFDFNNEPGSVNFLRDIFIAPGESLTYLFGTFTPSPAPVPPGTYSFFDAGLFIYLVGDQPVLDENGIQVLDENGAPLFSHESGNVPLASTCPSQSSDCAFTRTVVPLPAAAWVFGSGLVTLLGLQRRSRG